MKRGAFFDHCRKGIMGPTLDSDEVTGADAILDAMTGAPLAWCAYALATAWHETAHTMQPIREYGGTRYFTRMYDITGDRPELARKMGDVNPGDGPRYCGRGYVQLTWRANYRNAGQKLGVNLEDHPEQAMRPDVAAQIMRRGMEGGWFTGKGFKDYLPVSGASDRTAFIRARRIINGSDKAGQIADYAMQFQSALQAGEWA